MINSAALIDPKASLGEGVSVGPWSIIGPDVAVGEGRLLNCLEKNDKTVSKRCKQALKDVGLKK